MAFVAIGAFVPPRRLRRRRRRVLRRRPCEVCFLPVRMFGLDLRSPVWVLWCSSTGVCLGGDWWRIPNVVARLRRLAVCRCVHRLKCVATCWLRHSLPFKNDDASSARVSASSFLLGALLHCPRRWEGIRVAAEPSATTRTKGVSLKGLHCNFPFLGGLLCKGMDVNFLFI